MYFDYPHKKTSSVEVCIEVSNEFTNPRLISVFIFCM